MKPNLKLSIRPKVKPIVEVPPGTDYERLPESSFSYDREQADEYFETDLWPRRWSRHDLEDEFESDQSESV